MEYFMVSDRSKNRKSEQEYEKMAGVAIENWKEMIRDPKTECMSRDEMNALQSERLVKQVKNVYENVEFYRKKIDRKSVV